MTPIKADVTSNDDLSAAAAQIKAETGFVNAVIANAGIIGPTHTELPKDTTPSIEELQSFLWKTPQEEFTNTFAVNTTAMFYTCVAFLSLLDAGNKDKNSPTIAKGIKSQFIAISSLTGFRRPVASFPYPGSKAAATHIVKGLATYFLPYHIRANVIAPGIYPTDLSNVSFLFFFCL
jgi:NAD(P)-dependent dehydrogenase (short-subunit alcohol dehydrogenase family)